MARTLTITVDDQPGLTADEQLALASEAFSVAYKRPEKVPNPLADPENENYDAEAEAEVDNPQTKAEFFALQIKQHIRNVIAGYTKKKKAEEAAAAAAAENDALAPIADQIQIDIA